MRVLFISLLCLTCLLPATARANTQENTSVRILAYFTVGRDEAPATNVTIEQFEAHMQLIKESNANVIPFQDVSKAHKQKGSLPPHAVVITFDGGDKSIIETAAPILERYQFPFTVFLAPKRVSNNDPRHLNWDDIKTMRKSALVTFGLHPDNYENLNTSEVNVIRENLNNATARFRDEIKDKSALLSLPHGMVSKTYFDIIDTYSFEYIFGQNSAVYDTKSDWRVIPRFVMTEDYADANRFDMILHALPITASQITPAYSVIESMQPAIGFTASEDIKDDLEKLTCFAGTQDKPDIQILGQRVELRLKQPVNDNRFRVNCTLPVKDESHDKSIRWRWIGFLINPK